MPLLLTERLPDTGGIQNSTGASQTSLTLPLNSHEPPAHTTGTEESAGTVHPAPARDAVSTVFSPLPRSKHCCHSSSAHAGNYFPSKAILRFFAQTVPCVLVFTVAEVAYSWAGKSLIRFVVFSQFCLARAEMSLQAK